MKNDLNISDLLDDSNKEPIPFIHLENLNDDLFSSSAFIEKNNFLKDLMKVTPSDVSEIIPQTQIIPQTEIEKQNFGSDTVFFKAWRNIENISARLIEYYDETVVLECLIDKEKSIYEEREFRASLFEGYELEIGNLFYLRFWDRQNETKMEIHNDIGLTFISDFPKKDFTEVFKKSKLFKK